MKIKKITIALALLMGVVAAGLCSIRNSKESEFFNENLDALWTQRSRLANHVLISPTVSATIPMHSEF